MPDEPLTPREEQILAFERDFLLRDGHKQKAIRRTFGFAPSYYYALLARLIERPEAELTDPLLVRRLRRRRADRLANRGGLSEQVVRDRGRPATK